MTDGIGVPGVNGGIIRAPNAYRRLIYGGFKRCYTTPSEQRGEQFSELVHWTRAVQQNNRTLHVHTIGLRAYQVGFLVRHKRDLCVRVRYA